MKKKKKIWKYRTNNVSIKRGRGWRKESREHRIFFSGNLFIFYVFIKFCYNRPVSDIVTFFLNIFRKFGKFEIVREAVRGNLFLSLFQALLVWEYPACCQHQTCKLHILYVIKCPVCILPQWSLTLRRECISFFRDCQQVFARI